MRILIDTNVILDVLLNREPHSKAASFIFGLIENKKVTGFICATTITTTYFIASKSIKSAETKKLIKNLLSLFNISAVDLKVLQFAIESEFNDFENGVLHSSAVHSKVDAIITRNIKDFKAAKLPIYSPEEFIKLLELKSNK